MHSDELAAVAAAAVAVEEGGGGGDDGKKTSAPKLVTCLAGVRFAREREREGCASNLVN